jgi:predicted RNase H-like nuclease (RuvC/YqgF family)
MTNKHDINKLIHSLLSEVIEDAYNSESVLDQSFSKLQEQSVMLGNLKSELSRYQDAYTQLTLELEAKEEFIDLLLSKLETALDDKPQVKEQLSEKNKVLEERISALEFQLQNISNIVQNLDTKVNLYDALQHAKPMFGPQMYESFTMYGAAGNNGAKL